MKSWFVNKWFQYYLPITITLFMFLTLKREVITDGGYDRLYGLPFGFISNNCGCTDCFEVYINRLAIDLAIYFAVVIILFKLIEKAGGRLKTHWYTSVCGIIVVVFWVWWFHVITMDSLFYLSDKTPYTILSRSLHFGFFPW